MNQGVTELGKAREVASFLCMEKERCTYIVYYLYLNKMVLL